MITPKQKAQKIYRDAYMRWCYELSHDKNVLTARSICEYICNEVMGDMGADRGYEFWKEVKWFITNCTHEELNKQGSDDQVPDVRKMVEDDNYLTPVDWLMDRIKWIHRETYKS